ncbi:MAG: Arc family DNA-binding protein [Candidatus Rokubacteria bacterium]|nr:Arc family DNA-binding protein [Candidatus Rokubacteria bacterium]MBI2526537.1 Arc family DNA-binding protein [Candidatus Rokubacteria bacterium]
MPSVLLRDLDPATVDRLKARARRHHRSLQAELRAILERASREGGDIRAAVRQMRALFAGRHFGDSAALIRRDRAR